MSIAKDRKVLRWGLLVFGLPLLVYGSVHRRRPDPSPGPRPGAMLISMAVGQALHHRIQAPDTLEAQDVYGATQDLLGGQACWRFPVVYRVRVFPGGIVVHRATFWVRDGRLLRAQWDQ